LQTGKLMQYVPENGIYVYFRYDALKTVMIMFNSSEKDQETTTSRYFERTGDAKKGRNVLTDEVISLDKISIPAKTTLVLELIPGVTH
jgi:hypothetical protein